MPSFLNSSKKRQHADPHAVFVPAPMRHVRHQRHAGRRRQHLPRHRLADVPDLELTMVQNTMRAPPGSFSGGRSTIAE